MAHRFLSEAEIGLLLDQGRWRLAAPGLAEAAPGAAAPAEEAWRRRSRHAHAHAEVMVALRGRGGFSMGGRLYAAAPGLVAVLPAGLPHDNGLPPGSEACQLWLVWLGGRILVHVAESGASGTTRARATLALLAAEGGPPPAPPFEPLRLRSALALALAQVIAAGWRPAPAAGRLASEVLDAMRRHLESTGGSGASLMTLAQQAGVSRGYFARAFRQATGTTVGGFIDLCRLRRADELRRQGLDQAAVAAALGFANPQSWARWRRQRRASGQRR